MRRVALAFALFAFASFARAESLRVVAPANGATLRGGSFAELRWTSAQLPAASRRVGSISVGGWREVLRLPCHAASRHPASELHVRRSERRYAQRADSDSHRRRSARAAFREPRFVLHRPRREGGAATPSAFAVGTRRSGPRWRSRGSGVDGWRSKRIGCHASIVDARIVRRPYAVDRCESRRRPRACPLGERLRRSCVNSNLAHFRAHLARARVRATRHFRRSPSGLQPLEHLVP